MCTAVGGRKEWGRLLTPDFTMTNGYNANFICQHCGMLAISKCPRMRNVFEQGHPGVPGGFGLQFCIENAIFGQGRKVEWVEDEKGNASVQFSVRIPAPPNKKLLPHMRYKMAADWLKEAGTLEYKVLRSALCIHEWVCLDEKCDFGCCQEGASMLPQDHPALLAQRK